MTAVDGTYDVPVALVRACVRVGWAEVRRRLFREGGSLGCGKLYSNLLSISTVAPLSYFVVIIMD